MRLPQSPISLPLLLALLLPSSLAADSAVPSTLKLAYVPLPTALPAASAPPPKPKPFATLDLAPSTGADGPAAPALQSFLIPRDPSTLPPLLRVGVLDAAGADFAGSSTLATGAALAGKADAVVRVVVGAPLAGAGAAGAKGQGAMGLGPVLEVDIYLDPEGTKDRSWEGKDKGMPRLEVVGPAAEPRAVLNRAVVVGEDGKAVKGEEEKPKTLLQR